jgi:pimeloyl-ACP methyl ester carboxylesterase
VRAKKRAKPRAAGARRHADDLRGATRVAIDATKRVTEVVEGMHATIASGPAILGSPLAVPARAITRVVYGTVRGVTHVVGAAIDAVLAQVGPLLGESAAGPERAAILAALNGVVGDYLAETGNPLATEMCLCHAGRALDLGADALRAAIPGAGGKVVVLVHGSSMGDGQWRRGEHDYGASLARDLGYTPVYLRYNSGLHVSTNGRAFDGLLERLVLAWPVPVTELVIVGHSMGGLVARSACLVAETAGHGWRTKLAKLVTLGTPHHGAPLERGGVVLELILEISRYSKPLARLGKLRSAGVTDLRYGNVRDEDWTGRDRFARGGDRRAPLALPAGVACYAIAGSTSRGPTSKPRGDGLVTVDSALGRHAKRDYRLAFPESHQWIAWGVAHLDLLGNDDVYAKVRSWLAEPGT